MIAAHTRYAGGTHTGFGFLAPTSNWKCNFLTCTGMKSRFTHFMFPVGKTRLKIEANVSITVCVVLSTTTPTRSCDFKNVLWMRSIDEGTGLGLINTTRRENRRAFITCKLRALRLTIIKYMSSYWRKMHPESANFARPISGRSKEKSAFSTHSLSVFRWHKQCEQIYAVSHIADHFVW